MTIGEVISDACVKNGLIGLGEPVKAEIMEYALRESNRLIGEQNVQSLLIYTNSILVFDLTVRPPVWDPDQLFYTIGPAGSFTHPGGTDPDFVTPRPPEIISANLLITNTPSTTGPVRTPLDLYDDRQWMNVTTPGLGTYPYPTALYDDYDSPYSRLYLWPYPNVAGNQLELLVPKQTSRFTSPDDTFQIGPEYENQFMLTIAERIIEGVREVSQTLQRSAAMARSAVKSVNSKSPKMSTCDSGTPNGDGSRGARGTFYDGWSRR